MKNYYPVVHVSWSDAVAYCHWLSNKTGKHYRLPTEAEWEYAAGNGERHTKFSWGDDLPTMTDKVGNLRDEGSGWDNSFPGYNDGYKFLAFVGSFKANMFGLCDMNGNANEWCSDWYGNYSREEQTNPQGPPSGFNRAVRGGSFASRPVNCTVVDHNDSPPGESRGTIGFRIALDH
jgi:formylglycine-generating enzyme required for sulfatase activity